MCNRSLKTSLTDWTDDENWGPFHGERPHPAAWTPTNSMNCTWQDPFNDIIQQTITLHNSSSLLLLLSTLCFRLNRRFGDIRRYTRKLHLLFRDICVQLVQIIVKRSLVLVHEVFIYCVDVLQIGVQIIKAIIQILRLQRINLLEIKRRTRWYRANHVQTRSHILHRAHHLICNLRVVDRVQLWMTSTLKANVLCERIDALPNLRRLLLILPICLPNSSSTCTAEDIDSPDPTLGIPSRCLHPCAAYAPPSPSDNTHPSSYPSTITEHR